MTAPDPTIVTVRTLSILSILSITCALGMLAGCGSRGPDAHDPQERRPAIGEDGGPRGTDGSVDADGTTGRAPGPDGFVWPDLQAPDLPPSAKDARAAPGDSDAGGPLSSTLELPPGEHPRCTTPGTSNECGPVEVCRFYDRVSGRCETCDPCGNLNAPCTRSADCDILFTCYAGRCVNICPLGTYYCGPVEDCLDVGHPTHGVCRPF